MKFDIKVQSQLAESLEWTSCLSVIIIIVCRRRPRRRATCSTTSTLPAGNLFRRYVQQHCSACLFIQ